MPDDKNIPVISFLAIFGNGLVIYVKKTRRRRLLTSANWFVMSLRCWLLDKKKTICWHFNVCTIDREVVNEKNVLLFFNSAVNPIVYALLKNDFKRELRKMLCCRVMAGMEKKIDMTDNKSERNARNSVRSVYEMTDYNYKNGSTNGTKT
ncbi:uncharacterized protein LOC114575922 [Exaiptasia diaphana]|uniref:Uncharacterized protein n=1 Tax=Exaiptasia diaphana TaxID=2652724 RepID=A0A913YPS8_EXADI|nr:uncharacterized protein LOC114575922 [Exaiptasia diaphana]